MAQKYRNVGGIEASDALASVTDGDGAYMDFDTAAGNARFGAKGGAGTNRGVLIRTLLAGAVVAALTFTAAGAATFIGDVAIGGDAVATPTLTLNGTDATNKFIRWASAGVVKWWAYSVATSHNWKLESSTVNDILVITPAGHANLAGDFSVATNKFTVASATGNVSSGAHTATSTTSAWALYGIAQATAGSSFGLLVDGGTNASDYALRIRNQAGNTDFLYVKGDGTMTATGAATFASTVSATDYTVTTGNIVFGTANAYIGASASNMIKFNNSIDTITICTGDGTDAVKVAGAAATVTMTSLAGVGTRTVVVDANGVLSAP